MSDESLINALQALFEKYADEVAERAVTLVAEKLNSSLQHNSADPDELIFQDEARMMLGGVTSVTLTRWDRAGILRKHHIGKRVAYRRGDIDAIIKKGGKL